jgi:cytochrome P450
MLAGSPDGDTMARQNSNPARTADVFELYSTEIDSNPFPAYERLREQYPCYWSEGGQYWILSRYEDVFNAAQDWQLFSSAEGNLVDEIPGRTGATLGSTDPPRHDRLRALSQAAFTKRNLEYLIEPTLELADRALDEIVAKRRFDFVADFSTQITVGIIFRMLGLPERDHNEIRRKVILSVSTDKALKGRNAEQNAAFEEVSDFVAQQVERCRKSPQDDLITHLAEAEIDGDKLSDREVVLTTTMFVIAGVESLSSFMSVFALNLHDCPDARHRLARDATLVAPAIEESLRFNTSAQRFKRVLTRDAESHGRSMHRGDKIVLAYGSANRDWRKFKEPDRYDIDRRPQGHLGFGSGKHFCIGSHMARLVTEAAMTCFVQQVPDYRLSTEKVDWAPSSNFRTPFALPFEVD